MPPSARVLIIQPDTSRFRGSIYLRRGWTYAWTLRLRRAHSLLSEGVALLRALRVDNPNAAEFHVRASRKFAMVQLVILDIRGRRRTLVEARRLAHDYLVRGQGRRIR